MHLVLHYLRMWFCVEGTGGRRAYSAGQDCHHGDRSRFPDPRNGRRSSTVSDSARHAVQAQVRGGASHQDRRIHFVERHQPRRDGGVQESPPGLRVGRLLRRLRSRAPLPQHGTWLLHVVHHSEVKIGRVERRGLFNTYTFYLALLLNRFLYCP